MFRFTLLVLFLPLLLLPDAAAAQERIIGLVELPAIHAAVNEGMAGVATAAVTVRKEPDANAPVLVAIPNWRDFLSREHGHEQVSAAAYARVYSARGGLWYKVRYTVAGETNYGWVEHVDGAQYRDAYSLVSSGLAYLTGSWDRSLRERPAVDAVASVLEGNSPSTSVRVIDVYNARGDSGPWYLLAVVRGECTGEPLEIVTTGWVPAYTPEGENVVWFHSRGC